MAGTATHAGGGHPKSKRTRRRSRKWHRGPKPASDRYARQRQRESSVDDARELAYFGRFPFSVYPGTSRPHRHLTHSPQQREQRRIWLRLFERWQKVRERFLRFHGRNLEDRIIIKGTSIAYRDMRFWECRRCGWDAADANVWRWWTRLALETRLMFIESSRQKGVYVQNRRTWRNKTHRAAA